MLLVSSPQDRGRGLSPWEEATSPNHAPQFRKSPANAHPAWALPIPRSLLPSGGCLILFRLKLQNPSVFSSGLTNLATGSRFPGL